MIKSIDQRQFKLIGYLLILLILGACSNEKVEKYDLLLTGGFIVDVANDTILPNSWIGIRNDTIRAVSTGLNRPLPESEQVIDLEGQYVMPGLWDNHVHLRGGDTLVAENKELLDLFLAYGVTTVRDAGGDINGEVLSWRDQIAAKQLLGPRIFSSGPKLDGPKPAWPGSLSINTEADIEWALDSLETLGVDYVKFYDGSLNKDLFYKTIERAESRGLKTTGHMPLSATIREAVKVGLDGSEHMYYVLKSCSPLEDSLTAKEEGYGMMSAIAKSYSPDLAKDLFKDLAKNGVSVTPTLHISRTLTDLLETDHSNDSLRKYVGSGIQQTYSMRIERAKRAKKQGSNSRGNVLNRSMEMIRPMQQAGVMILAGSDSGAFNSFVYPGSSLIEELIMLEKAGLSPSEALGCSVINGPAFFGLQEHYGAVSNDKIADLIVLENNPLESTENLFKLTLLIRQGQVFDRSALVNALQN